MFDPIENPVNESRRLFCPIFFGHLDSFERHLEAARVKGLMTHIHFNQDLGFDIDSPGDYKRMSERPPADK